MFFSWVTPPRCAAVFLDCSTCVVIEHGNLYSSAFRVHFFYSRFETVLEKPSLQPQLHLGIYLSFFFLLFTGKIKELFNKLRTASSETEKDKILSELQPVITYANIAVDECDFGTGLEIGIDLFCSGLKILEQNALNSLVSTYTLLKRTTFAKIIQVCLFSNIHTQGSSLGHHIGW